jgi:hypothetical protein
VNQASPFGNQIVPRSAEVARIAALPRRVWSDEAAAQLAELLTRELKTPGGTMRLRPVQAIALYEAMECGGLFGPIRVGGGKTLCSGVLPVVLEAKRPILLLPAALIEKTAVDFRVLREHWRIATNLQVISYESLGLVQSAQKLEYIQPDLIVADECFVAGTPVRTASGIRAIETICVGELVETSEGFRRVEDVRNRESEDLYDITIGSNKYTCTGNHPFLTTIGWRVVRDLAVEDEIVRNVQESVCCEKEQAAFLLSRMRHSQPYARSSGNFGLRNVRESLHFASLSKKTLLRAILQVREFRDKTASFRKCCGEESWIRSIFFRGRFGANEEAESNDEFGGAGESSKQSSFPRRLETTSSGGQWSPYAGASKAAFGSVGTGVGAGETFSLGSFSNTGLFSGYVARDEQDCGRGRWFRPSKQQNSSEGCTEGHFFDGARVARVESVKRRRVGEVGYRARVYNLSVEGPETYVLGGGEIVHNCHYLKNYRAGRTRRVTRYMREHPDARFVGVSGTVMKGSVRDFAHLLRWALKDRAPIPTTDDEVTVWADALDEKVNPLGRRRPEALFELSGSDGGRELAQLLNVHEQDDITRARRVFQSRLLETRGVVASSRTDGVTCSLRVSALEYQPSAITEEHIRSMRHGVKDARGKFVVRPWMTPDGWAFSNPIEFRMYLRQLALGFHSVWDPRPPLEWMEARRNWASFVRETLEQSQSIDTELQVANEVDRGRLVTDTLARWRAVRDTFTIQPKDVWHDDAALAACAAWMERARGIVWCEHRFFARRLAALTGAVYYGANGLSDAGESITVVKPGRAIIASVQANATGRNLQMFAANLVTSCPPSAQIVEQLIGRTHRDGQEADEVTVDVLVGCREHHDAFQRALDGAQAAADTLGHDQKLLLADVVMPDISQRVGALWQ